MSYSVPFVRGTGSCAWGLLAVLVWTLAGSGASAAESKADPEDQPLLSEAAPPGAAQPEAPADSQAPVEEEDTGRTQEALQPSSTKAAPPSQDSPTGPGAGLTGSGDSEEKPERSSAEEGGEPEPAEGVGNSSFEELLGRPEEQADREASSGWLAMKSLFWLGVVVILIAGLAYAFKRWIPGGGRGFHSPAMEVLGRTIVNNKNALYLVKVGDRLLVLACGQQGLRTLSEITDLGAVQDLAHLARKGTRLPFKPSRETHEQGRVEASGEMDEAARAFPALARLSEDVDQVRTQVEKLRSLS